MPITSAVARHLLPLVAVGALAACGGSNELGAAAGAQDEATWSITPSTTAPPPESGATAPDDACGLLSESHAEALLGSLDGPGLAEDVVGGTSCTWWNEGLRASFVKLVVAEDEEDAYDEAFGDEPQDISPVFGPLGYLVEEGSEVRVGWIDDDGRSVVLTQHSGAGSPAAVLGAAAAVAEALA